MIALLLAITCTSERGWAIDTADCGAIYQVAEYRAETQGTDLADALRDLSPRLHRGCRVSRRWLCELSEDGARPPSWPRGASWERRRPQWLATLEEAREIVGGRPGPCLTVPRAWGSRLDVARRVAAGYRWTDAGCGLTRNRFGTLRRP